jgi:hypothetical protein
MAGAVVGAAAGEAVGDAAAITGAPVMAMVAAGAVEATTDALAMPDVGMPDEDMQVADTGVGARPAALRAAASMVGPQVDSTVVAVAAVSTAEVVAMAEAAVTGNQHLHRIAWMNGWRPALPAVSLVCRACSTARG